MPVDQYAIQIANGVLSTFTSLTIIFLTWRLFYGQTPVITFPLASPVSPGFLSELSIPRFAAYVYITFAISLLFYIFIRNAENSTTEEYPSMQLFHQPKLDVAYVALVIGGLGILGFGFVLSSNTTWRVIGVVQIAFAFSLLIAGLVYLG